MYNVARVEEYDAELARKRCELILDENGVAVRFGPIPVWNPEVEALRLMINVREQTVVADTVAHDYGDDIDAYNHKVADKAGGCWVGGDPDEYRVMVWGSDVIWAAKRYADADTRAKITDLIIAAKVNASSYRSVFEEDAGMKSDYERRMVKLHRDAIEAIFAQE